MRTFAFLVLLFIVLSSVPLLAADLININTADEALLDTLPGIGPTLASRIIEYRDTNGPFASIEEIQNVSGIGPATFTEIQGLITVSGGISEEPEEEEEEEESTPAATSTVTARSASSAAKERIPVRSIELSMPEIGYVNQPVSFNVGPEDTVERLVRYSWNFGDGNIADTKSPVHTYAYPGMYVVFVTSRYLGEEKTVRGELTILPATLSLVRTESGDIQLHNNAKYEIDLGGFTLQGEKSFTIPPHTILLSSATLTARRGLLETGQKGLVSVTDPSGIVVAAVLPNDTAAPIEVTADAATLQTEPVVLEAAEPLETELLPVPTAFENPIEPMVYRPELPATVGGAEDSSFTDVLPYSGLLALLVLGIFGVYSRKRI